MSEPVMSFPADGKVASALRAMSEMKVRHLLIREDDEIVGIVSRRELDVIDAITEVNSKVAPVRLAMMPAPMHWPADTPLAEVARAMAENKIGAAVIVRDDKAVGIFTTVDALRALAKVLSRFEF